MVEQPLSVPEVHGSNPVIGKIYSKHFYTVNFIEKTKIKKRDREWPIKKYTLVRFKLIRAINLESKL